MITMFAVTMTALVMSVLGNLQNLINSTSVNILGDSLQLFFGISLLCLGVTVAIQGIQKVRNKANTDAA